MFAQWGSFFRRAAVIMQTAAEEGNVDADIYGALPVDEWIDMVEGIATGLADHFEEVDLDINAPTDIGIQADFEARDNWAQTEMASHEKGASRLSRWHRIGQPSCDTGHFEEEAAPSFAWPGHSTSRHFPPIGRHRHFKRTFLRPRPRPPPRTLRCRY